MHAKFWSEDQGVDGKITLEVTRLRAGRPGFDSQRGARISFSLRYRVQTGSGAHPALYSMMPELFSGGGGGVKRVRREADHSPPCSAGVKKTWSYTSTPYSLHDVVLG
jgi:hypothetical protein